VEAECRALERGQLEGQQGLLRMAAFVQDNLQPLCSCLVRELCDVEDALLRAVRLFR
jgi:hypothetical protein